MLINYVTICDRRFSS